MKTTQVCRLNWNVGVVTFFGANVVKLAGLQQACISEVLLIDGITAFCVQVLHDESFLFSGIGWFSHRGSRDLSKRQHKRSKVGKPEMIETPAPRIEPDVIKTPAPGKLDEPFRITKKVGDMPDLSSYSFLDLHELLYLVREELHNRREADIQRSMAEWISNMED